jgi:WD40 repeat protein
VHTLTEHAGNAVAVAFSPDGEFVATASTDGTGRIWRTSDWGLKSVLTGHTNALTNVAFSEDGEHVVTSGKDGTARISHVESGDELIVLSGHRGWVTSGTFTGDAGSPVVTASADGSLRVWDAVFQPELTALARFPVPVTTIAVDDRIHVGTSAGRGHELDLASGERLGVESAPKRRPLRVVGPNGAAATIRGRTVVLRRDGRRTILRGHRDRVTAVSFSSSGDRLASASLDHDVRVWDVASGEQVLLVQHNTAVHDAQFSPNGRWLVTAANRGGLWDAQTGTNVARLQGHEGTLTAAAFAPDGVTIVTGGVDGAIRTYRCEICGGLDELLALAQERLAATGRQLTDGERERFLD